jgi:adenylate kinase family enzyme
VLRIIFSTLSYSQSSHFLYYEVDTVRQRLESYAEMTAPLVEYYQAQDVLKVFQGTESDVIYPMIKAHLKNLNL